MQEHWEGLHKHRGCPCGVRVACSKKQFVNRVLLVKGLFIFSMEGSLGKKSALENLEILLGHDLAVPRALAGGEAPARQLLLGIKDEDGH